MLQDTTSTTSLCGCKTRKKTLEKKKEAVGGLNPWPFHFCEPFYRCVVLPQFAHKLQITPAAATSTGAQSRQSAWRRKASP
jgi:hypothetical protein